MGYYKIKNLEKDIEVSEKEIKKNEELIHAYKNSIASNKSLINGIKKREEQEKEEKNRDLLNKFRNIVEGSKCSYSYVLYCFEKYTHKGDTTFHHILYRDDEREVKKIMNELNELFPHLSFHYSQVNTSTHDSIKERIIKTCDKVI